MTIPHAICRPLLSALILAVAGAAGAHGVINMYDRTKTVVIEGTMIDYQWTSPHVWVDLAAKAPDGSPRTWQIEASGPTKMLMTGWTARTLAPGDTVSATINPLKNGARGGHLVSLRLPDGTILDATGGGGLPKKPGP